MSTIPIITIKKAQQLLFLKPKDLLYCRAANAYVEIHLVNKPNQLLLSSCTLSEIETYLEPMGFYRIHHKYLINTAYLSAYDLEQSYIVLSDGVRLKLAMTRKKDFLKKFVVF